MATSAEELTECIVCFIPFRDPQLLPCQHTFCKRCVDQIADAGAIKCPKCNTVSLTADVKPDFRLGVFLDALAKQAEELNISKQENSDDTNSITDSMQCESCEEKPVSYWCKDCELWLCKQCWFSGQ